ncbi:16S rRNA (cytosine(1402)-N(4))-methyltransferase RsmH [Candidatus Bipolaricaulota bacterium]|nr:16S rRNA (cytosine(1402)-N(4))-methyltransferase RsmH [Candidatus Bipolaricaulota bacterium]
MSRQSNQDNDPPRPIEPRQDAIHIAVLTDAVVRYLHPRPNGVYVDATVGLGGHSSALLQAEPEIRIIGIDRDRSALDLAAERLGAWKDRVSFHHARFSELLEVLDAEGISSVDGVLLDVGVSSLQLDTAGRGFSFRLDGPLDMRMDDEDVRTASEIVASASEADLARIFREFGEERFATRIARHLIRIRQGTAIDSTATLAQSISDAVPKRFHVRGFHPATRCFQALRIAVNDELSQLAAGLEAGFAALHPGGVLVAISFHSLEDRLVKQFLRHKEATCICPPDLPACMCDKKQEMKPLTRRPIVADAAELASNPRARSAKLRAGTKLAVTDDPN